MLKYADFTFHRLPVHGRARRRILSLLQYKNMRRICLVIRKNPPKRVVSYSFYYSVGGINTESITKVTPLLEMTSAVSTIAVPLTVIFPFMFPIINFFP